ncbi:hypothetical protein FKM82_000843 [Ascaphus truei]
MSLIRVVLCAAARRPLTPKLCPLSPSSIHITGEPHTVIQQRNHSSHHVQEDMPQNIDNPYKEPPKKCILCGVSVDYKNTQLLSQFVSPHTGRIYGRHITGLCWKKQKEISKSIKRAHIMGFMPVTYKDPAFLKDPKISDI